VRTVKAVSQNYNPNSEILILLEDFRKMLNDCIRIGLAENVTSKQSLTKKAYPQLAKYKIPTYYRLTAISKAVGILSNYRKIIKKHPDAKKPYATKQMLTDCYGFRIMGNNLRLVIQGNKGVYIPLNKHTRAVISGYTVRSVTLTVRTVSIAFSQETALTLPTGLIGIDRNLENVTTATLNGKTQRFDLSEASRTKAIYREVKSHFKRNDVRVVKRIQQKYGQKQRNKVQPILHNVSKQIVEQAKVENMGIVMENLTGIRKLYRKGNGQGNHYRSRLNSWSFYELQRQIEYKAKWEGIPVISVNPQKTSSTCAICGSEISECTERKVYCHQCNHLMDRDENAALNIVQRGLRFKPDGFAGEAMVKERLTPNPLSRCEPVALHHPKVNTLGYHLKS
jgi:putative transposase